MFLGNTIYMANTIKMPSAEDIDKAYKEGAGRAPAKYKAKVLKTSGVIEASIAAQGLYEAKMSDPNVLARRAAKLANVTDEEWRKAASTVGAERIGKGMLAKSDKRKKNYESTRTALDGLSLPDKTTDWRANLANRAGAVIEAQKKAAGKE